MATVLLVDDDHMIHQTYSILFSMRGHILIAKAFNGVEALEIYPHLNPKPDVVLMDQRMPRMDGLTTTRELKRIDPNCCIIFISADETVREEALAAGAIEFISKPISFDDLLAKIALVLKDKSKSPGISLGK